MARRYATPDEMRARFERDVRAAEARAVLWYGGWAVLAALLVARFAGAI
jgi:hypothetical protein